MKLKFLVTLLFFIGLGNKIVCEDYKYKISEDIVLIEIEKNFYVHKTWYDFPDFGRFSSNGLLFIKNNKALLIDTPNTNEQTEELVNYLKDSLQVEIKKIIVGHSHSDCLGGLSFLHSIGVESICGDKTEVICKSKNLPLPQKTFSELLKFSFEGEKVICRYFGVGHTIDNIVVYFPEHQILFGGCLIKGFGSKGLGNIREAVISDWDNTVSELKNSFPKIKKVIPGHGKIGNNELLNHTISLVKKYKSRAK